MKKYLGFVGFDPGTKGGAIALLVSPRREKEKVSFVKSLDFHLVPTLGGRKDCVDVYWLNDVLQKWNEHKNISIEMVAIEDVHAFPKQGVASAFWFGDSFGAIKSAVAAIRAPCKLVTPARWQKATIGKRAGGNHELIRSEAIRMFPDVDLSNKGDHNRACALMLAKYAKMGYYGEIIDGKK